LKEEIEHVIEIPKRPCEKFKWNYLFPLSSSQNKNSCCFLVSDRSFLSFRTLFN